MKVFVYGSLKKGGFNHSLLAGAQYVANGTIEGTALVSLGAFPGLVIARVEDGDITHGEIYDVKSLSMLDNLESEGHLYKRVKMDVHVTDPYKPLGMGKLSCWVYVYMIDVPQDKIITDGNWNVEN